MRRLLKQLFFHYFIWFTLLLFGCSPKGYDHILLNDKVKAEIIVDKERDRYNIVIGGNDAKRNYYTVYINQDTIIFIDLYKDLFKK